MYQNYGFPVTLHSNVYKTKTQFLYRINVLTKIQSIHHFKDVHPWLILRVVLTTKNNKLQVTFEIEEVIVLHLISLFKGLHSKAWHFNQFKDLQQHCFIFFFFWRFATGHVTTITIILPLLRWSDLGRAVTSGAQCQHQLIWQTWAKLYLGAHVGFHYWQIKNGQDIIPPLHASSLMVLW